MGGKTAIFGMDDDSEPKRGSILQHPEHDARIRDPMASGSNRLRACCLHQADFGHFPALKSPRRGGQRSEEHTSELQSLMRISYAVFCLKKKKHKHIYSNKEHKKNK